MSAAGGIGDNNSSQFANNVHHATPLVNDDLSNFWVDPGERRIVTALQGGAQYGWDILGSVILDYKTDQPIIYLGQAGKKDELPSPEDAIGVEPEDGQEVEYVEGDFIDYNYGQFDYFTPATKRDYKKRPNDILHYTKPRLDILSEQPVMVRIKQGDAISYIMSTITVHGWGRGICQNLNVYSNSELVLRPKYQKMMGELKITLSDMQGQPVCQFETDDATSQYVFQIPDHLEKVRLTVQPANENTNFLNAGFEGLTAQTGSFIEIDTMKNPQEIKPDEPYKAHIILHNRGYSATEPSKLTFKCSDAIMNTLEVTGLDYSRQGNNFTVMIPSIPARSDLTIHLVDKQITKQMRADYTIGMITFTYQTQGKILNKQPMTSTVRGKDFSFKVDTPMRTIQFVDQATKQALGMTEIDAQSDFSLDDLPIPKGYKLIDTKGLVETIKTTEDPVISVALAHQMKPMQQTKKVTREIIIHYPNEDPKRIEQSATFKRENQQDLITHEIISGQWTNDAVLPALPLKEIPNYRPNQTIPKLKVSHDDGDVHLEIYYQAIQPAQPAKPKLVEDPQAELAKQLQAAAAQQQAESDNDEITLTYKTDEHTIATITLPNTTDYKAVQSLLTKKFTKQEISMNEAMTIFQKWREQVDQGWLTNLY